MTDLTGAGGLIPLIAWLLGGFILCSALFAMNLGHWYLNVHGLPIAHLKRAVKCVWRGFGAAAFVGCFGFWSTGKFFMAGEWMPCSHGSSRNSTDFFAESRVFFRIVFSRLFPCILPTGL